MPAGSVARLWSEIALFGYNGVNTGKFALCALDGRALDPNKRR